MKTSVIGFILWVAAATFYIFKIVARLMEKKMDIFTIEQLFGLEWIDKIPWAGVQKIMTTISTTQLYVILFFVGLAMVILGTFQKK